MLSPWQQEEALLPNLPSQATLPQPPRRVAGRHRHVNRLESQKLLKTMRGTLSSGECVIEKTKVANLADVRPTSEEEDEDEEEEGGHNKMTQQNEDENKLKKEASEVPHKPNTRKRKRKNTQNFGRKKKKSKSTNERRNIRSIRKDEQLDKETLNAQQEEMERMRRIEELKNKSSLGAQTSPIICTPSSSADATVPEQTTPKNSLLKSLKKSAEDEAKTCTATSKQGEDVILPDSVDEGKGHGSRGRGRGKRISKKTNEANLADVRPTSKEEDEDEEGKGGHSKMTQQNEDENKLKKEASEVPNKPNTRKRKRKNTQKFGRKKKKSKSTNERRNIRSIRKDEQLDKETLNAQQEEMERMRRIEELKNKSSLGAQTLPIICTPSSSADAAGPEQTTPKNSLLKSLKKSAEDEAKTCTATSKQGGDVILPDSVDEGKGHGSRGRDVDSSSDEEDGMECSDQDDGIKPGDDPNNSGCHVDDPVNQPDSCGRVLVNVGHPPDEPDIFLLPQLARAVKPHQIGGIRFLYDNLVESLACCKTSNGFGCILAHSMGLGKTLQVISFIDIFLRYSDARTVLCIVPVNTLQNWISEFDKWIPKDEDICKEDIDERKPREFSIFFVNDYHKTTLARATVIEQWYTKGGVLLMGYEMYRLLSSRRGHITKPKCTKKGLSRMLDVEEVDKSKDLLIDIHEALIRPGPDLVICDEGHRIKNAHASISQSLKSIQTRRRVVLTGYPMQNNLIEYWCMVDFVRPNFLGNKKEFSNMFERPITNGQCADSTPQDIRLMRFRAHVLHSLLEGFVQRRGHAVLRAALPPKEEYVLFVRLSSIQKRLYAQFMRQSQSLLTSLASNNPLKAFAVCCKIWNHPDTLYSVIKSQRVADDNDLDLFANVDNAKGKGKGSKDTDKNPVRNASTSNSDDGTSVLIDKKEPHSITYDWAEPLLTDYEQGVLENGGKMLLMFQIIKESMALGDKCLVFSQSLLTLNLIEEFLGKHTLPQPGSTEKWAKNKNYFRLDGSTPGIDREKLINQFNNPDQNKYHLFLLSTRAGCLGINLIGANRVVIFDASWNPCHDCQAVCRVYRYGQTKPCYVYRLVSNNTMERKIYERQINKQGMSDRVVDEMNIQNNFTRRQVESLLAYEDKEVPPLNTEGCENRFPDSVLTSCMKELAHWITKEPFTHESLLIDRKDQRLTKIEKQFAKQSYEEEKKLKEKISRPSHPKLPNPNPPVPSVRPTVPFHFKPQCDRDKTNTPMQKIHSPRPGVFMQSVQTTTDISIPGTISVSDSEARTKIPAGETVLVIKTAKGVYIRTSEGEIYAVRSPDDKKALTQSFPDPPSSLSTVTTSTTSVSYGGKGIPFSSTYPSVPWMNTPRFGGNMNLRSQGINCTKSSSLNKSSQSQGQTKSSSRVSVLPISSPSPISLDSWSSMSSSGDSDEQDANSSDSSSSDDCNSPQTKTVYEKHDTRIIPSMVTYNGVNYNTYSPRGFSFPTSFARMKPPNKGKSNCFDPQCGRDKTNTPMQKIHSPRPGVSMQKVQTTTDISIPGTVSVSDSGARTKIPAGETVLVIKTAKGVYIRTSEGEIYAVRSADDKKALTQSFPDPPSSLSTVTTSTTSVSYGGKGIPFSSTYPRMNTPRFGGHVNLRSQGIGCTKLTSLNKSSQSQGQTKSSSRVSVLPISSPSPISLDSQSSMSSSGDSDEQDSDSSDSSSNDDCDTPQTKAVHEKQDTRIMPSMVTYNGVNYNAYSPRGFSFPTSSARMKPPNKGKSNGLDELKKDKYASSSQGLMSGGKAFISTNSGAPRFSYPQHLSTRTARKSFHEKAFIPTNSQRLTARKSFPEKAFIPTNSQRLTARKSFPEKTFIPTNSKRLTARKSFPEKAFIPTNSQRLTARKSFPEKAFIPTNSQRLTARKSFPEKTFIPTNSQRLTACKSFPEKAFIPTNSQHLSTRTARKSIPKKIAIQVRVKNTNCH